MSSDSRPGVVDPESVSREPNAPAGRSRSRLHLVYFALAAFDIVAISCTLVLSHSIMTAYEDAVMTSRRWAQHVSEIAVLGELARQTNAPGNDVFESKNAPQERARRDAALIAFNSHLEMLRNNILQSGSSQDKAIFTSAIASIRSSADRMTQTADKIFASIERGDHDRAGLEMAAMDRSYGELTRATLDAVNQVQAIQIAHLEHQVEVARELRVLEAIIGGLIVLIVISVALYGAKIAAVMRRNEDRHDQMISKLEATQSALRYYADNVAHELRSPLNKILVGSEVALSRSRTLEEYQEALLSNMEECQSLARVVESLLFMAKAEHVTGQIDRQAISIARELGLIESFYAEAAADSGVKLSTRCPVDLTFRLDKVLFQRAVSNLVSNAIAHTSAGGGVTIEARLSNGSLVVEVTDNGEGIPEYARDRVFDRFYRADQARSSTSGRIGLGLPITKSIVDLHGGTVALASETGQGTTVALTFPNMTELA
jgi:two-component system, OmpR family, heavy metal sensor histidine kinase CusS